MSRREVAPAFQVYAADAIANTAHLTREERGDYWTLAMHAWWQQGVPADPADLARLLNLTPKKFTAVWARLAPLFELRDGRYVVAWQETQRSKQADVRAKRSAAGQLGNASRWGERPSDPDATPPTPPEDRKSDAGAIANDVATDRSAVAVALAVAGQELGSSPAAASLSRPANGAGPGEAGGSAGGGATGPRRLAPGDDREGDDRAEPEVPPGLTPGGERLLAVCYADPRRYPGLHRWRRRREDVAEQLRDALDPHRPGARLDKATWVRARSAEHLDAAVGAILADPPRDLDTAVVCVLLRLHGEAQRAARGQTVTEARRREETAARGLQERHGRAVRRAVREWMDAHPEEAARTAAAVDGGFGVARAEDLSPLLKRTRDEVLVSRVAKAIAFPDLDTWAAAHGRADRNGAHAAPEPAGV